MFRVAKQLVRQEQTCGGAGCVRDDPGKIVVEEDRFVGGLERAL